jgi:hypothetical protein
MMVKKLFDIRLMVVIGLVLTLFVLSLTFGQNTNANDLASYSVDEPTPTPELPPREVGVPTETPEPEALEPEHSAGSHLPKGGALEMEATFSKDWPWQEMLWNNVWLEVEWTDGETWFKVDGWRGNLDTIDQRDGSWVGQKTWWVAPEDLGTGPFRWVVYDYENGNMISTSEEFELPADHGQATVVEVALNP